MKRLFLVVLALFATNIYAVKCYVTVVKGHCWETYNVTVKAIDTSTGKTRATVIIPEGSYWSRQSFKCKPGESIQFSATFNPIIWESDRGKTYYSQNMWNLPEKVKGDENVWGRTVCFPREFGGVSMPPQQTGACNCKLDGIPPLKD